MVFELIQRNLENMGYRVLTQSVSNKSMKEIVVSYQIIKKTAYVIALIDYHNGNEWGRLEYDGLIREIKSRFYDRGADKIQFLNVLVTSHPEKVRELGIYIDDYWIVEDEHLRLMIYEDQVSSFLNVKEIIESSLQGEELKGQISYPVPWVTILLIAANAIVFLVMEAANSTLDVNYMFEHGAMHWYFVLEYREYYRLFTSMFLHFGIQHLFNNMIVLGAFGYYLEGILGRIRFITLYICSGLAAGLVSMGYNMYLEKDVVSAGASGAVFGVIGVMFALVLLSFKRLGGMGIQRMLFFIVLSIYSGFTSQGVDNAAHIGGFLFGFLITLLINPNKKRKVSLGEEGNE